MHIQPSREDLIELTSLNPFERFDDGRASSRVTGWRRIRARSRSGAR